jgi:hypothetical protein
MKSRGMTACESLPQWNGRATFPATMHYIDSFRGMPPMIISASRRTDIAAFYAEWMVHRLRKMQFRYPCR